MIRLIITELSTFDLVMKGGWLMIPLFLLSLIAVFIFIDRFFYIRYKQKSGDAFFEKLKFLINERKVSSAIELCEKTDCSEAAILVKGLKNLGRPIPEIQSLMEMEGKLEVYKYEKNIYFLGVIATIAPMLGFIGTIAGVIKIFYSISQADNISISLISSGLYEKLVTSGVGLGIGILAYLGYHFLNNRVTQVVQKWDFYVVRFFDLINQ